MDLFYVYKKLLREYGPQGWWPVYIRSGPPQRLIKKEYKLTYGIPYSRLKKYKTSFRDPYFEIAAGAILTQSAAWKNAAGAIVNLYNAKALTPPRVLKLGAGRLQKLIRPAGYFKQKTKKLLLFSRWLVYACRGDIKSLGRRPIAKIRELLLQQWGIGKETADSIILYALNKPIFAVDEYTRRLCRRFKINFRDYDDYRQWFEKAFGRKKNRTKLFREMHALIVASGKEKHVKM